MPDQRLRSPDDGANGGRTHAVARLPRRVGLSALWEQLCVGLLLCAVMPALVVALLAGQPLLVTLRAMPTDGSMLGVAAAFAIGLLIYRKTMVFPGVRAFEYVLPAFLASFAMVLLALFVSRIGYSRGTYLSSFVIAISFSLWVTSRAARGNVRRFLVVPGGEVETICSIDRVACTVLATPQLPNLPVNGLVVDLRYEHSGAWERLLADAALRGTPVYHVKQLTESLTGRVHIEHLSENNLGSLAIDKHFAQIKLTLDIVCALVALPLLLPAFIAVAVVIKLDTPGPVFFRQARMGYRGNPFCVFKFRTMRLAQAGEGASRHAAMTLNDDYRITRVGRYLRRTRIDELPQLLNIVRGEMSWIGPRPEALPLSHWYESELAFYRYRHIVRPGISGWAQVNQGHVVDLADVQNKLELDFYYIKYFSAWLDLLIVFKTMQTVFTGNGAR